MSIYPTDMQRSYGAMKWVWINVSWQPRRINAVWKENIDTLMSDGKITATISCLKPITTSEVLTCIWIQCHVFLTDFHAAMEFHLHFCLECISDWILADYQLEKAFFFSTLSILVCLSVWRVQVSAVCLSVCLLKWTHGNKMGKTRQK